MPDRFGDPLPDRDISEPVVDDTPPAGNPDAIAECGRCDPDGLRDGFLCLHTDPDATKRGLDHVYQTMRWEKR